MIFQMCTNLWGIDSASFYIYEEVWQRALGIKYGHKTIKTKDIFTIDKATGLKWVPKCPGETPLVGILGFWRDHVVLELLETKN